MSRAARQGDRLAAALAAAQFRRWLGVHFAAAVALFAVGGVLGAALVGAVPPSALSAVAEEGSLLPERITVATVAANNLLALGIDALGLVTVGAASALVLLVNGLVVGAVLVVAWGEAPPLLLVALVVPHAVVELPAFWLVAAVAFRVYHRLARYLLGWDETPLTRQELFEVAVLLALAVVMILVAAVIEVHVTPAVAELLTGREITIRG